MYELLADRTKMLVALVNVRQGEEGLKVGWAYFRGGLKGRIEVYCDRTGNKFTVEVPEDVATVATAIEFSSKSNDYFLRLTK